jgi:hypothetical protein
MSDMPEFSPLQPEAQEDNSFNYATSVHEEKNETQSLSQIEKSLDGQSYFLGEVPQQFLVDPQAFLPLNSDRLIGHINAIEILSSEISVLIGEEVTKIQALQKKIHFWENRIEKNKTAIAANEGRVKQNGTDMTHDKRNRDYWWGRAEQVNMDFACAAAANRRESWDWLIKKYGLKNADGQTINASQAAVEEICNGTATDLAAEYRNCGNKYEEIRRGREVDNIGLIGEISQFKKSNETLQGYISMTYAKEVEPLQEGVLLYKELDAKIKSLGEEEKSTYGDLRVWAEPFLNEFIRLNSKVPQSVVTDFRKLASIPLPAEHC